VTENSHITHFLLLILGLATCLFFFMYFRQNTLYQMVFATIGCLYYSLWGIMHGRLEQRLNRHIALEYIAVSAFILSLIFVAVSFK